jgi:hypothetical protein
MTLTHRYFEQNAAITVGAFQTSFPPANLLVMVLLWNKKRNHRIKISLQTVGPLAFKGWGC